MPVAPTLYDLLGIDSTASPDDVEAAFKAKAKMTHPDVGGDIAAFQALVAARDALSDPDKRARYDAEGTVDDRASNERRDALDIVQGLMAEAMNQIGDGPIYTDIVAEMPRAIGARTRKIERDIEEFRRRIGRFGKLAARFKSTGKSNVLAAMVENKIAGIKQTMASAQRALDLHKVALEIIKDHSFEVDPKPFDFDVVRQQPFQQPVGPFWR